MKRSLLILLAIINPLLASFENKGLGANFMALSLSGIASRSLNFTASLNPAMLHFQQNTKISLFYRNYYGIPDLNQMSIHGTLRIRGLPIGVAFNRFGNKLYGESQLIVGSAYALDDRVIIGLNSSVYFLDIKNYNSAWTYGFSLAALYLINETFTVTAKIENINEPKIGSAKESLPMTGTLGFSVQAVDDVELMVDIYKEDRYDFEYRFAARINVINRFNFMIGFRENINSFSTGIEYATEKYSFTYGADIHPTLNISHGLGMSYAF
jgi:hypothetical protein